MGTPSRIVSRCAVAVTALALVAAGCHSGGGSAAVSEPGPYTRADVDAIVLGPNDAPEGTSYVDGVSGFQDLQAFARDDVELAHLQEDGFQIGHLALFFPNGHANGGALRAADEPEHHRAGDHRAVPRRGRSRAVARALRPGSAFPAAPGRARYPADGLGDTSFGLQGKTPDGARVQMYVWRIGNLILAVSASGPVGPVEVRALADLVNARAS